MNARRVVSRLYSAHTAESQWMRQVMDRDHATWFRSLETSTLDAVEVSGNRRAGVGWRSYNSLQYPQFNLLDPPPVVRQYDVVLCEQVLEHVEDPALAMKTLFAMTRPGGRLLVSTPFLVTLHETPRDFWRPTPAMLGCLLSEAGFLLEADVQTWGNAAAVYLNLRHWPAYRPWLPLKNDPACPVVVWAYARRPIDGHRDAVEDLGADGQIISS